MLWKGSCREISAPVKVGWCFRRDHAAVFSHGGHMGDLDFTNQVGFSW
jgi:hypothetical protein